MDGVGGWVSKCDLLIQEGQSPTAEHRALYSVTRGKPQWKEYEEECLHLYNSVTAVQQRLTQHCEASTLQKMGKKTVLETGCTMM